MIINKLEPSGYCRGVINAINTLERIVSDENYPKPIYVLGQIVHNSFVTDHFNSLGVINILNDFSGNIKKIFTGTIVISAHGISKKIITQLNETSLTVVNLTCPYVNVVHQKIEKMLDENYACIYIGHKGHPETNGILGISDDIILLTMDNKEILNLKNDKIFVSNQTTFSYFEVIDTVNNLKKQYPNLLFDNDVCNESTRRQQAVKDQTNVDLVIVVGDMMSSNTNRLLETALNNGINAILVSSVADIRSEYLLGVKSISIIGGASTPNGIIDEILEYLNK